MDVFLIPTATSDRYELYYEASGDEAVEGEAEDGDLLNRLTFGVAGRLKRRFNAMLVEAEEWRHRRNETRAEPGGILTRGRRAVMGFIVERIAEQRLLWHLRKVSSVCVRVPTDVDPEDAERIIREMLIRDAHHHRKWFWIDVVLLIPAAAMTVVPGPNVLGLYFTFQVVSHYFSWTGAKCGLAMLPWKSELSFELSELRIAMTLAPAQRKRRFHEVAERLRLEHLPTFLEDVAARPA